MGWSIWFTENSSVSLKKESSDNRAMKAFCSDCGEEVETQDVLGRGTETYRCAKCGAKGTMSRRRRGQPSVPKGKAGTPLMASVSLNVLDLLNLKLGRTEQKCPHCGNFRSAETDRCPFCNEPMT